MSTPDYKAILLELFNAMPAPDSMTAPHAHAWLAAKRALDDPHGEPPPPSRWQCPECGSRNVLVDIPAWFRESTDGESVFAGHSATDITGWRCESCEAEGEKYPDEAPA